MHRSAADAMLVTTVVLWALNFTVTKYILQHGVLPLQYASTRYLVAGAIFAGITIVGERSLRDRPRRPPAPGRLRAAPVREPARLRLRARVHNGDDDRADLRHAADLHRTVRSGHGIEHLTRRFALAACVSFAGVVLVAVGEGGGISADVKGDLLALVGSATWAAYSLGIGPLMRRYSPYRISYSSSA